MKKQFSDILRKEWDIPHLKAAEEAIQAFSFTERVIFYGLALLLAVASFSLLWKVNTAFIVEVPKTGGTLVEGMIGTPRFINPLLALSDTDRDVSALVYSGLLKATPQGEFVPDLASEFNVSEDGRTYTFILRDDAYFHDGKPITARDVAFTIARAQDPLLKSPKRANWEGVRVEVIHDKEVQLLLRQPYAPFLENATMGILPEHIWKEVDADQFPFSQHNIEPIGSGPYRIEEVKRNAGGIPVSMELSAFKRYVHGRPYIDTIALKFFPNEQGLLSAYERGEVESMNAISPKDAELLKSRGVRVERATLPRIFGVFFNQNQAPVLAHKEVRQALNIAVDKNAIVDEVLNGYGTAIQSPIPLGLVPGSASVELEEGTSGETRIAAAIKILEDNGWKRNEETGIMEKEIQKEKHSLAFTISTSNATELKRAAEMTQKMWQAIGASVEVRFFDTADLNQNIIRPRRYDALLFGEIIGRDLDFFAFWHSSQRNDPGLNIAMYTNIKVDKTLETARTATSTTERINQYLQFEQEVTNDIPAVFTYSPDFLYVLPEKVRGTSIKQITMPSERFLNVNEWYVHTDKVWKIFVE